MLLSQEPVNLYMTFALISFGVTSLSEKYCPILKDLNTTLVFTFKSFPILHIFSSPVVCLCDTPGVVRRPSSVVCVVSSNLTTADMKEII